MKPCFALCLALTPMLSAAPAIKVLIVDGQNNHDWKTTTPILKKILEDSGKFQVDVATSPPQAADMSGFNQNFSAYNVHASNYSAFGGGVQRPHHTNAAFKAFCPNARPPLLTTAPHTTSR